MIKRLVGFIRKVLVLSPAVPKQVDIEVSTACNLECRMCKRRKLDFGDAYMPFEMFAGIIDRLPAGVETVSFGGYGEMTTHPRFFEMVRYAKSRGYWTETTSNGTLLKEEDSINAILDSGLDVFRVSIEHVMPAVQDEMTGHAFSGDVLNGLRRLSKMRTQAKKPVKLVVNCVVHENNLNDIKSIIRYAEKAGLDLVELIRLDTCLNDAKQTLHLKRERKLYRTIESMKKNIRVITPANRFRGFRRLYNLQTDFCPSRYEIAHISIDGSVTPCAFGFAKCSLGNISEAGLKKIWQSRRFRRIRKNGKNKICRTCAIYKWD